MSMSCYYTKPVEYKPNKLPPAVTTKIPTFNGNSHVTISKPMSINGSLSVTKTAVPNGHPPPNSNNTKSEGLLTFSKVPHPPPPPLPPNQSDSSPTQTNFDKPRPVTAHYGSQYGKGRYVFAPQGYWGGYDMMISNEPYLQRRFGTNVPEDILIQRGSRSQQRSTLDLSFPSTHNGGKCTKDRLPKVAYEYSIERWPPASETHFTYSCGGSATPLPPPSPRPTPARSQHVSQISLSEDYGEVGPHAHLYTGTTNKDTYGVKQLTPRHEMQSASKINLERNRSSGGIRSALIDPSSLICTRRLRIDGRPVQPSSNTHAPCLHTNYVTTYSRDHQAVDSRFYRAPGSSSREARVKSNRSGIWEGPLHRPKTVDISFRRTSGNRVLFGARRESQDQTNVLL